LFKKGWGLLGPFSLAKRSPNLWKSESQSWHHLQRLLYIIANQYYIKLSVIYGISKEIQAAAVTSQKNGETALRKNPPRVFWVYPVKELRSLKP